MTTIIMTDADAAAITAEIAKDDAESLAVDVSLPEDERWIRAWFPVGSGTQLVDRQEVVYATSKARAEALAGEEVVAIFFCRLCGTGCLARAGCPLGEKEGEEGWGKCAYSV
jgi:predicted transcriptional regulator